MCDDNVDDFEPENYEQFQQGEVLTKLPRNIMSDSVRVWIKMLAKLLELATWEMRMI